jgi:uncharacterized membrane-anchored protein YhcB (DUF1043 family)
LLTGLQTHQKFDELEILQSSNLVIVPSHNRSTPVKNSNLFIDRSREHIFAIYNGSSGEWLNQTNQSQDFNNVNFICETPNTCIKKIQVANQEWLVQFLPTPEYLNAQPISKIWLKFLIGFSVTAIVTIVLEVFWSRDRNYRQQLQLFDQMKQECNELKQQKTDLEILLETTTQHSDAIENELQKLLDHNSQAYDKIKNANIELRKINSEIMLLGKMINLLQACFTKKKPMQQLPSSCNDCFPISLGRYIEFVSLKIW